MSSAAVLVSNCKDAVTSSSSLFNTNKSGCDSNTSTLGSSVSASKLAHKILHYGSRHVIRNTGWTTRLTKELPQLKPIAHSKTHSVAMDHFPVISSKKTNVVTNNGMNVRLVGPPSAAGCSTRSLPQFIPTTVKSSTDIVINGGTFSAPVQLSDETKKPCSTTVFVPNASNSFQPNVCFVPLSNAGSVGVINVLSVNEHDCTNVTTGSKPSSSVVVKSDVTRFSNPCSIMPAPGSIFIPGTKYCAPINLHGIGTNQKHPQSFSVSSSSNMPASKTVKTLAVFPSIDGSGGPDIRVLNTQVRISNGIVTQVNELTAETEVPTVPMLSSVVPFKPMSNTCIASSPYPALPVYLTDCNGAKFGYYETIDRRRIRIAHDTCGQRYSPFWLVPQKSGPYISSDVTVNVTTCSAIKEAKMLTEAEVSAVTTVFTFEPLLVSGKTLVPVSGSSIVPCSTDMPANCDDDSVYRCYLCKFWSENKTILASHWLNVHMPDLQYCCPYCDRKFFTNVRAQMHVLHHHPEHKTSLITFRRSTHFAHTLSVELMQDENIAADQDDDETTDIITFEQVGNLTKTLDSLYSCRKCSYSTRSAEDLRSHQSYTVHNNCKPFYCPHCKPNSSEKATSFPSECDLNLHIQVQHSKANQLPTRSSRTLSQVGADLVVRADIPWNETWEEITVSGNKILQCRRCAYRDSSDLPMWQHVLREHKWPSAAVCPSCVASVVLQDSERLGGIATCVKCDACIVLGPTTNSNTLNAKNDIAFICNICSYRTNCRSNMMRHIRYNHTKCRPFACPYCNYVGVERPKVKAHIAAVHPKEQVLVINRPDIKDRFQKFISDLFKKLVSVKLACETTLSSSCDVGVSDANRQNDSNSDSSTPSKLHQVNSAAEAAMIEDDSVPSSDLLSGNHFKCKVCGYCCTDRSCMSRHIKYMHISARPHSCPYCSYNNVEKTKVRIHIKSHHPGQQKSVHTDRKLLEQMSWCAKKFYVKIDHTGNEIGHHRKIPHDLPPGFKESNNSTMTELSSGRTTQDLSDDILASLKDGEIRMDDDVEFELKPDWNGSYAESVFIDPVIALDHNYFQPTFRTETSSQAADYLLPVKQEPLDLGYEAHCAANGVENGVVDQCSVDIKPNIDESASNNQALSNNGSLWTGSDDDFTSDDLSDDSISLSVTDDEQLDVDEVIPNNSTIERVSIKKEQDCSVPAYEPPAKQPKLDSSAVDTSKVVVNWNLLKMADKVRKDPKISMNAVVELEDVMQIILAWQSGALSVEEGE